MKSPKLRGVTILLGLLLVLSSAYMYSELYGNSSTPNQASTVSQGTYTAASLNLWGSNRVAPSHLMIISPNGYYWVIRAYSDDNFKDGLAVIMQGQLSQEPTSKW